MLLICALSFLILSPAAGLAIVAPLLELIGLSHMEAGVMGVLISVLSAIFSCMFAFLSTASKVLKKISPDLSESERKARNDASWEKVRQSAQKVRGSFKKVEEEYVNLPPDEKERINRLGADLARMACKAGSEHLARKGGPNAAAVVDRLSKF